MFNDVSYVKPYGNFVAGKFFVGDYAHEIKFIWSIGLVVSSAEKLSNISREGKV